MYSLIYIFLIIKFVVGVDAPVLASVKIAKNAQLVAVNKYINFGMEGALEGF